MRYSRHLLRFSRGLTIAAILLLPLLVPAQTETQKLPGGVEEIYLAKDDGAGQAGEPVKSFETTDPRIYCIVQLTSDAAATVKMHFVAVSVPGVKAETRVVTTTYTTKDGEDRVNFFGKPKTKWAAGKYRVEIFVDGKMVKDLAFDITGPVTVTGSSFVQPTIKLKPKPAPIRKPKPN